MRSIECLIREYPNKTGIELLEIQSNDILEDEKKYFDENKLKHEFIDDINTNGGYYCGRFGLNQYTFYSIKNLRLRGDKIYMDVERIVLFIDLDQDKSFSVNRELKTFQNDDNYSFQNRVNERVTKKEWDEVNEYLINVKKFWDHIKHV